ncbi:MAG: hypothetical protein GY760_11075, partial [Deltaproteobacteria bacterium]|nr:hypothetical protein [Deltaproteobacteria bacterium]
IENALLQHDRIKEVFACKTESINDLCVYYTLDEENSENNTLIQYNADIVSTEHLRNYLLKSLPDFMIPTFFIQMVNFPLTLNGKIDRKALPEPDRSVCTGQEYVAPENEVQETLVEIWQEVLGVKRVGILDDFFDLGGHSLKLTSIVSRINSYFEMNITMMDIFKSPTIASLSLEINAFLWTTNREQETNRDNSKREIGEI